MGNPYVISFGTIPKQNIPRIEQRTQIVQEFNSDPPSTHAYMIVGVRGSGKTVLLSEVAKNIGDNWINVDLSSEGDMLRSLTSQLYGERSCHKLFIKANFDFSFMGIGIKTDSDAPAYDDQTAITMMLEELAKNKKRVLITVDEVINSKNIRLFTSVFQIFVRNELPVFLLMAGIPENVFGLMDERRSTFLYRTPRVIMTPLNFGMMKNAYSRNLKVDSETATKLATLTNGYPFAYQALGYVCWNKNIDVKSDSFSDILAEYDFYLQEFSYIKIWDEMSAEDKILARAIATRDGFTPAKELSEIADMDQKKYSVYRDRLKRKGIIDTSKRGELAFSLPRFNDFINSLPQL